VKVFRALILAVGAATFLVLLWKLDPAQVGRLMLKVGALGFLLILLQEVVPHFFNALGWLFAIPRRHAGLFRFGDLYQHRIQGDGVNYLTPSATIAGEFTRALLVDNAVPADIRLGGVVTAKCTQSLAQIVFTLAGVALLLPGSVPSLARYDALLRWGPAGLLAVLAAASAGFWMMGSRQAWNLTIGPSSWHWLKAVPGQVLGFHQEHPLRWWASTFFFVLGYAWTAVEVWMICAFLGLRLDWRTALLIEVLSNTVDMIFFMVPAKVGTQEAGKTGIFHLLGLGAQTGLALGIVRHIREVLWAGLGLLLYTWELRRNPRASLKPAPAPEPVLSSR